MAILKSKDIKNMNKKEIEEKINELKKELIKNKANITKNTKVNIKEIKKTIARLLTFKRKLELENNTKNKKQEKIKT